MNTEDLKNKIEKLQNSYNNIKIFSAVPMGIMLLLYFFSFAAFIDNGYMGLLTFEIITSILFILTFLFLNQYAFFVLKLLYQRKADYQFLFSILNSDNIKLSAEKIQQQVNNAA